GAVNTGYFRLVVTEPKERVRTQQDIVNLLNRNIPKFNDGRIFAIQEQTISVGTSAKTSLPIQFVIQNSDFDKLKATVPKFFAAVASSKVFQGFDINLKFNKPEVQVAIDRVKAAEVGVAMMDVSRTLDLALSASRLQYFIMGGKQYQVIAQ